MRCIGCPIARFHTVEDVCREHGDSKRFLADLRAAATARLLATKVISRGEAERQDEPIRPGIALGKHKQLVRFAMTMRCRPPSTQP